MDFGRPRHSPLALEPALPAPKMFPFRGVRRLRVPKGPKSADMLSWLLHKPGRRVHLISEPHTPPAEPANPAPDEE